MCTRYLSSSDPSSAAAAAGGTPAPDVAACCSPLLLWSEVGAAVPRMVPNPKADAVTFRKFMKGREAQAGSRSFLFILNLALNFGKKLNKK